jgi:hypothetical protein
LVVAKDGYMPLTPDIVIEQLKLLESK